MSNIKLDSIASADLYRYKLLLEREVWTGNSYLEF